MKNEIASDLRFVGLHQDGTHLILATPDGTEHRLAITEMVRAAVRRDRPALEQLKNEASGFLPPREIQAQIRAGRTAEEVALDADIPLVQVRRYEGPVLAERAFVATTARNTRLDEDPGSPTLGEIVTDRLAHRGVDFHTLEWDAYRSEAHGWIIHATFAADGEDKVARWTFDAAQSLLHAIESEARWLSETSISDSPIARRLTSVHAGVYDVENEPATPLTEPEPADSTDELLAQLDTARGTRLHHTAEDQEGPDEGTGYGRLYSLNSAVSPQPATHDAVVDPPVSQSELAVPDEPGPTLAGVAPAAQADQSEPDADPAEFVAHVESQDPELLADIFGGEPDETAVVRPGRKGKKQRTRMPSWDEIMFGAKPE